MTNEIDNHVIILHYKITTSSMKRAESEMAKYAKTSNISITRLQASYSVSGLLLAIVCWAVFGPIFGMVAASVSSITIGLLVCFGLGITILLGMIIVKPKEELMIIITKK